MTIIGDLANRNFFESDLIGSLNFRFYNSDRNASNLFLKTIYVELPVAANSNVFLTAKILTGVDDLETVCQQADQIVRHAIRAF